MVRGKQMEAMKIKILGIDPSLRNMGFAHAFVDIDTHEVEITHLALADTASADKKTAKVVRKNSDDLCRAKILHEALIHHCQDRIFAFVEVPHGSQSARAMASYGICVGVLAACPIPIIELTASEVKIAATGDKQAAKEEMIEWAMGLHPNANWLRRAGKPVLANEHLADAIACIYAGLKTNQFTQAAAMFKRLQVA